LGGFLDVLDAYNIANVYLFGGPKGTETYNAFLRGVKNEGLEAIESGAGRQED